MDEPPSPQRKKLQLVKWDPRSAIKNPYSAPWLEHGKLWETVACRRARTARNHIRTMLEGRKAYTVYARLQQHSFFYPQRLWMAFSLSIWIQLLMTLFFSNVVRWGGAALKAAQEALRRGLPTM